ncbi:major tail protein V [Escherichia coli PA40]|nr:major tail protein V [Escherichia coli PA40]
MATPNPLEPVKGAGTTLWVYNGKGDAYANPLSDDDWQRLAKVKDLTPGEMTAEPYDDNYLDDEDADWTADRAGAEVCRRYQFYAGLETGRRRSERAYRLV